MGKILGFLFIVILSPILPATAHSASGDPVFTLRSGSQTVAFKRSELLARSDVTAVHVEHDPSYSRTARDYAHAIPIAHLFEKLAIPSDALLQFDCLDGFSAPIAKERLLNTSEKEATAYL